MSSFKNARVVLSVGLSLSILFAPLPRVARPAYAADDGEAAATELTAGIEAYQAGRYDDAVTQLTRAQQSAPANSSAALYLGLAYLKQDRVESAITAWQRYTQLDPATDAEKDADLQAQVRRYLTLLQREENERLAQQAIRSERSLGAGDPNTVAVAYFQNLGSKELAPLQKGMAALLIADLSKVPDLRVVEREQMQAMITEMKLSQSGLVAKGTGPRVGKMLGAGKVATGSYNEPKQDELKVDSVIASTATASVLSAQAAEGPVNQFWEVENVLALGILTSLGYDSDRLEGLGVLSQIQTPATKSLPAFVAYSQGLDAKDREDYKAAGAYFQTALREDPNFELARLELLALPAAAASVAAIASSVSSSAPSAAAASAGVAAGVGAAAGISTTALVIGGGVIVAGGIAAGVAAGSGGGGDDGGDNPPQCRDNGETCNDDCCEGLECLSGVCCSPDGNSCSSNAECCSASCINGLCGQCADIGGSCGSNSDCCTGLSCDASTCKDCTQGTSCSVDGDCCSGFRCESGSCEVNPCPPGENFCNDPGEPDNCPIGQVCAPDCESCTCPADAPCSTPGGSEGCADPLVCAEDCSGCVCPLGAACDVPGEMGGCGLGEVCNDLCECACACDQPETPCPGTEICNDSCVCEEPPCNDWDFTVSCTCFEDDCDISGVVQNRCEESLTISTTGAVALCNGTPVPLPLESPIFVTGMSETLFGPQPVSQEIVDQIEGLCGGSVGIQLTPSSGPQSPMTDERVTCDPCRGFQEACVTTSDCCPGFDCINSACLVLE